MRARFRPRRPVKVSTQWDILRDRVVVHMTDGVMATTNWFAGEHLAAADQNVIDTMIPMLLERFDAKWLRIIAERSPRMRAAYDRRRRARRARARA